MSKDEVENMHDNPKSVVALKNLIGELEQENDQLREQVKMLQDGLEVARQFVFNWDNCRSSGEWPVRLFSELRKALAATEPK